MPAAIHLSHKPSYQRPTYQRHCPEDTVLYKIVQENLETFLSVVQREWEKPLPDFVEKEFRDYLKCGILAHGFLRNQCTKCHHEHLVAFSCKRRGFCPSCGGRRMAESAMHLIEEVLPQRPVRQWVLSFPIQIRLLLAVKPKLMGELLRISTSVISQHLKAKVNVKAQQGKTGVVSLIQRFGGSINLNVHFHQLFLDGAYELDKEKRPLEFRRSQAPTPTQLSQVLEKIIKKTTRLLEKRGFIKRDEDDSLQFHLDDPDGLAKLQAGAVTYRFALGPNKGKKALTLKSLPPDEDHGTLKGLVAKNSGFSLHAGVAFSGTERAKIERLCRYITRPAIALERLSFNERGQVVYKLKKSYTDGTTSILMSPLELMERLAALVPRPKVHLTRFAGVFAPHYKYRSLIVPKISSPQTEPSSIEEQVSENLAPSAEITDPHTGKGRIRWAKLLKRVFAIDVEVCQKCGGQAKIIACIEDPFTIKKILSHLGLPYRPPALSPARGPPATDPDPQTHFDEY